VKNTGRCKELLLPGARVILQKFDSPNNATHLAFGEALLAARIAGVQIAALDCIVTENSLCIGGAVPMKLEEKML